METGEQRWQVLEMVAGAGSGSSPAEVAGTVNGGKPAKIVRPGNDGMPAEETEAGLFY